MSAKPPSSGTRTDHAENTKAAAPPQKGAPAFSTTPSPAISNTSSSAAQRAGDPSMDVRLQILRFETEAIKERAAEATANEKAAEARVIELESKLRINLQRFEDYERRLQLAQSDLANEKRNREAATEEHRHKLDDLNEQIARNRSALQIKQDEVDRLRHMSESLKRDIESIDQTGLNQLISELTQSLETERGDHQAARSRNTQLQDELTQKLSELTVMKNKFLAALDQRQVEKQTLEEEIQELKSQVSLLHSEKSELLIAIQEHEAAGIGLKRELAQSEARVADFSAAIEKTRNELQSAEQKITLILSEKEELVEVLKKQEAEEAKLKSKLLMAESRGGSFSEKIEQIKVELAEAEQRTAQVNTEKQRLEQLLKDKSEEMLAIRNELHKTEARIAAFQEKAEHAKEVELENSQLHSQLHQKDAEALELRNEIHLTTARAQSYSDQIDACKLELAQTAESLAKQRELLEQEKLRSSDLMQRYSQLEHLIEQLRSEKDAQLEDSQERLAQATQEIAQERQRQQDTQNIINRQLEEIRQYAEKIHQQELQAVQLNAELAQRQERAMELAGLLDQSRVKYEEVSQQLTVYKTELDRERGLKAVLEERQKYLDSEIKKLFTEKEAIYKLSIDKVENERAQNLELIARIENLESVNFDLSNEKAQSKQRISELGNQIEDLCSELEQVNSKVAHATEIVQIKQDEVERLRHLNDSLKRDIEAIDQPGMNQAIANLHAELEQERLEHQNTQSRSIELQDTLTKRLSEISLIKSKLSDCSDQREEEERKYQQEIEDLNNQIDELTLENEKIAEFESLSKDLKHQLQARESQIQQLQSQIDQSTKSFNSTEQQRERETLRLTQQGEKLEQELQELRAKVPTLEKSEYQLKVEVANRESRIENLTQQIEKNILTHKSDIAELQQTIERLSQEVSKIPEHERAASDLNTEIQKKSEEIRELQDQFARQTAIHDEEISKLSDEIELLKNENKKIHEQELLLTQSRYESSQRQERIRELTDELQATQTKLNEAQHQLTGHLSDLENHRKAQSSLLSRQEALERDVKRLASEKENLFQSTSEEIRQERTRTLAAQSQCIELSSEKERAELRVNELSERITELQHEKSEISTQLNRVNEIVQLKQDEVERLRHLNEALKRDIEAIDQPKLNQTILELGQTLEQEQADHHATQARIGEFQDQITRNMSEIALLKAKLESCTNQRDSDQQKFKQEREELKAQMFGLVQENQRIPLQERLTHDLKTDLNQRTQRISELEILLDQQLVKGEEARSRADQEASELRTRIEQLQQENKQIHQQELQILSLKAEVTNKQQSVENAAAEITELHIKMDRLLEVSKEDTQQIHQQQIQAIALRTELEQKHARALELSSLLEESRNQLEETKKTLAIRGSELDNERALKSELEKRRAELELEIKRLQELNSTERNKTKETESRCERLESVVERLHAEKTAIALEGEHRVQSMMREIGEERSAAADRAEQFGEKISQLQEELDEVQAKLTSTAEAVQIKQEEVERLRHLNEALKRDIESIDQPKLNQTILELSQALDHERLEHTTTRARNVELQDLYSKNMSEIGLLKAKLTSCAEQRDSDQKNFKQESEELKAQMFGLVQENQRIPLQERLAADLKSDLSQRTQRISELEILLDQQLVKSEEARRRADQETAELRSRIELLQEENKQIHKHELQEMALRTELEQKNARTEELSELLDESQERFKETQQSLAVCKADLAHERTNKAELEKRRQELESEIKRLQDQITVERNKTVESESRCERLEAMIERLHSEKTAVTLDGEHRVQNMLRELNEERAVGVNRAHQLNEKIAGLQEELDDVQAQLARSAEAVQIKQEEVERLRHLNESLKRDIIAIDQPKLIQTIAELTQSFEQERSDHSATQARIVEFQDLQTKNLSEISLLKAKLTSCGEQRDSEQQRSKQEREELKAQIGGLVQENQRIPLQDKISADLRAELNQRTHRISELEILLDQQLSKSEENLKRSDLDAQGLRARIDQLVQENKKIHQQELQTAALRAELSQKIELVQSSEVEIAELNKRIDGLLNENKLIHKHELQEIALRTELDQRQARTVELAEQLEEARGKFEETQQSLAVCKTELNNERSIKTDLEKRRQELELEIKRLQDQGAIERNKTSEMESRCERLEGVIERLHAEKTALSVEVEHRAHNMTRELNEERATSVTRAHHLNEKISELQGELEDVKAQLGRSAEIIQMKQEEAERLRHLNESLKRDIEAIDQPKLNQTIINLTEALDTERADHVTTQSRIIELQDTISRQASEVGLLKSKLSAATAQSEADDKRNNEALQSLTQKVESLTSELNRLGNKELEAIQIKAELEETSTHRAELQGFLEKSRRRLEELSQELVVYKSQLAFETTAKQDLQNRLTALEAEIKRLTSEKDALHQVNRDQQKAHDVELTEFERRCQSYEAELHKQELIVLQLKNDVNHRNERAASLADSLNEAREKLQEALKNLETQSQAFVNEKRITHELQERSAALDEKLKAVLAEKQLDYQQYQQTLKEERAQFTEVMNRCGRLETVVDRLTQEKTAVTIEGEQRVQTVSQELIQERSAHRTRITELSDKVTELSEEIEGLKAQIERGNELTQVKQGEVDRLRHLNESLARDIEAINQPQLNQAIQDLNQSLATERSDHETTRARVIEIQDNLGKALSEQALLRAKWESAATQLETLKSECTELNTTRDHLTDQLLNRERLISELKQKLDDELRAYEDSLAKVNEKLRAAESRQEDSKVQLGLNHTQIEAQKALIGELKNKINQQEGQLEKLRLEKTHLIREAESRFKSLKEELAREKGNEVKAVSIEAERRIQAINQELVEERSSSRYKLQQLQDRIDSITRELESNSKQLSKAIEDSTADRQKFSMQNHQQDLLVLQLRSELEVLKQDRAKILEDLQASNMNVSTLEQNLVRERQERDEILKQGFAQKSQFTEKQHEQEIAVLNLRNELKQREQEGRALQQALDQRELRMGELQKEVMETRERLRQASELAAQERSLLEEERVQSEGLGAQFARAEATLRLKQDEIDKLRHLNESLKRDIDSCDVDNLKQIIAGQTQELELERKKFAETAKVCSDLQESIARQRSEVGLLQNSLMSVLEKTRAEQQPEKPSLNSYPNNYLDEAMATLVSQKSELEKELIESKSAQRQTKKSQATKTKSRKKTAKPQETGI